MSGIIDDGLINYNNHSLNPLFRTPLTSKLHPHPSIHLKQEILKHLQAFLV